MAKKQERETMLDFLTKEKNVKSSNQDDRRELESERQMVEELQKQLQFYKEREQSVTNLIIEAQNRAKTIIEDAEKTAAAMKRDAEHGINAKMNQIEEASQRLVLKELDIRSRGAQLKADLKDMLQQQLSHVDQMDISGFSGLSDIVTETAKEVEEVVKSSRTVIQFPELSETAKSYEAVLPVYNFSSGDA